MVINPFYGSRGFHRNSGQDGITELNLFLCHTKANSRRLYDDFLPIGPKLVPLGQSKLVWRDMQQTCWPFRRKSHELVGNTYKTTHKFLLSEELSQEKFVI